MAGTLPDLVCCPDPCESPSTVEVPGPPGDPGDPGDPGAAGANAFTTFTSQFTMPAEGASSPATVGDTSWMVIDQVIFAAKSDGSVRGYLQVMAITNSITVTLKNLENTATSAYPDNSAPGSIFTAGSKISPGGVQGPNAVLSGAAGGDLKGTYPNPKIGVANTKGSSLWGNGTDTVAVPAGTNGHMIAYDSTDAEGNKSFKALPLTGDTNVLDNAIARLDGTTGLPIPMQASPMVLTDNGALQTQYGNAKGTDAVDVQASHNAVTQVASGNESVISGGRRNTASGVRSVVAGGDASVASGQEAAVGGGSTNTASADRTVVGGGDTNQATAQESAICGGNHNIASGVQCFVGGGDTNVAGPGVECVVGGGGNNNATVANSTVAGGDTNNATAIGASVGGGAQNSATAAYATVPGGASAKADKYGQVAWASGAFSAQGDAQASKLVMRNNTANATPTELFLDGLSLRCTIPTGKSWMFQLMLVARKSDGLTSIYKSEGLITNVADVVTMPAAATTTEIYDGIGLPPTPVAVTADDPNNALIITCTGLGATAIKWVASVQIVEVA